MKINAIKVWLKVHDSYSIKSSYLLYSTIIHENTRKIDSVKFMGIEIHKNYFPNFAMHDK